MRVLIAVGWYFPDSAGGTETYVRGLVAGLKRASVDVAIAVPAVGTTAPPDYQYESIPVFRFPAPYGLDPETNFDAPEPVAWTRLLARFNPDVVDFHSITTSLGVTHVKSARAAGKRTVFTVHVPGLVCARGTMMRFGTIPCDGDMAVQPCTRCRLDERGVPKPFARLMSLVPPEIGDAAKSSGLPHWLIRPVMATRADRHHRQVLSALEAETDRFVAVSAWLIDALARNGVSRCKLRLCRQGIEDAPREPPAVPPAPEMLRVGFIGRYDRVKGLHVLIDAIRSLRADIRIEAHVWGIARSKEANANRTAMLDRAAGDPRILFHEESHNVDEMFEHIDVLVVPSVWFETGPLVVLEAQARSIPVIGTNLGGISERVRDGHDGILVPAGDVGALAHAIARCANDRGYLQSLKHQQVVRTMSDAVDDTLATYRELLHTA